MDDDFSDTALANISGFTTDDSYSNVTPPSGAPAVPASSDAQGSGILGLISSLGTAYLGTQKPATTALNAVGQPVSTTTATSLVPGISNSALVLGGVAVVGIVVLLSVLRK